MIGRLRALLSAALPRRNPDLPDLPRRKALRWAKCAVWIVMGLVTLQSVLLVAGAWRNDRQISRHMGIAQAEVLSAGPRRSTIEFVTPDRITYRPELGVLYPSELATGMRICVEYDKNNPDLVRVQHRNAAAAKRFSANNPFSTSAAINSALMWNPTNPASPPTQLWDT